MIKKEIQHVINICYNLILMQTKLLCPLTVISKNIKRKSIEEIENEELIQEKYI